MIITIRGTSGSGKSHLVRSIMELYEDKIPIYVRGRKQPLVYTLSRPGPHPILTVVGHYETPCGGCDTISNMQHVFELVKEAYYDRDNDVLFEGLIVTSDANKTIAMHETGIPITVITLDTPIEMCLEGVNSRRRIRMKEKYTPVNPKNTVAKIKSAKKIMERFLAAGMDSRYYNRATAYASVKKLLKL